MMGRKARPFGPLPPVTLEDLVPPVPRPRTGTSYGASGSGVLNESMARRCWPRAAACPIATGTIVTFTAAPMWTSLYWSCVCAVQWARPDLVSDPKKSGRTTTTFIEGFVRRQRDRQWC
jgi:hypothetical protein